MCYIKSIHAFLMHNICNGRRKGFHFCGFCSFLVFFSSPVANEGDTGFLIGSPCLDRVLDG
jgi:hypothetical protein